MNEPGEALFIGAAQLEDINEYPFDISAELLNQPAEFYTIPDEEVEDA